MVKDGTNWFIIVEIEEQIHNDKTLALANGIDGSDQILEFDVST